MKKILMAILTIAIAILISALVLYINVFSEKAKNNIQKEEQTLVKTNILDEDEIAEYEKKIDKAEEKAKENIKKEEITEAKIEEAITYIEKNIELTTEDNNTESFEKMAYYGAYLKNVTTYKEDEKKSEISLLGENTLAYSKEALKFIENNTKTKENIGAQEQTANVIESTIENNTPETSTIPSETSMPEQTAIPPVNVIEVNTSTTLEKAKTKVKASISKINNLNRRKLITELIERIKSSSQN